MAGRGKRDARKSEGVLGLWLCVCLASAAGCSPPPVTLKPKTYAYTPEDYEAVYRAWTRSETPFDFERMETVLRVTATFEAYAFRWAYVVRYAEDFGLPVEERSALLEATLDDAAEYHRFFVTLGVDFATNEVELTDKGTAWRVMLMDDRGRQTRPVEIEYVRQPTPAEARYFPTVGPQRRAFRIAFPVHDDEGNPTLPEDSLFALLRFTGPRGTVDLVWNFALDERRRRRMEQLRR